ncbi:serine and arginine rich splicing factor 5b isoform X1 [Electrophorus electricus]|uniref:serine and arginine rich splicing factor 5b isoform X1 n=1 Tax=Electrophorus electricus TaxID=8005 RepID=UPI0015D04B51|nr:serine and arginine rich splicing factor 5b isoform X1 [Electrophorus electricus]XP_035380205.1 serine and arginine rich splicing factor 5b isoform X1 [Electrophorus electricus]
MSGCRIFIGRLNPSAREKDVERFFKGYGRIREIDLKRGFGFVEFDDPRDAEDAVCELDGKELCNERVTIEHARVRLRGGRGRGGGGRFPDRYSRGSQDGRRNPAPMRTENRLIVENLSSRVSWQDLKDFMRQAGEVTFADAHRPKLNEGVVEFASHSDLKNALEKLSGKEIHGRKIKLVEAARKKDQEPAHDRTALPALAPALAPAPVLAPAHGPGGVRRRAHAAALPPGAARRAAHLPPPPRAGLRGPTGESGPLVLRAEARPRARPGTPPPPARPPQTAAINAAPAFSRPDPLVPRCMTPTSCGPAVVLLCVYVAHTGQLSPFV